MKTIFDSFAAFAEIFNLNLMGWFVLVVLLLVSVLMGN